MERQTIDGKKGQRAAIQILVMSAILVLLICGCQQDISATAAVDGRIQEAVAQDDDKGSVPVTPETAFGQIERGEWEGAPAADPDIVWTRQDLDGDGQEELIMSRRREEDDPEQPIERIYAYHQGRVEEVFSDLGDYTEYHFITKDKKIVYNADVYGQVDLCYYASTCFDGSWASQPQQKLYAYYFSGRESYSEDEMAYLREAHPDTYGAHGRGIYCFLEYPAPKDMAGPESGGVLDPETGWMRIPLSKKEFLETFYRMTGEDFFVHRPDWEVRFDEPQEDISDQAAFQEFLAGRRKLYGWLGHGVYIQDMLVEMAEEKEKAFSSVTDQERMKVHAVEYAYMDCGADEREELVVRFVGQGIYTLDDDSSFILVITNEGGRLTCIREYMSYERGILELYRYGYSVWTGIAGAYSTLYSYECLDAAGRHHLIAEAQVQQDSAVSGIDDITEDLYKELCERYGEKAVRSSFEGGSMTKWVLHGRTNEQTYYTYNLEGIGDRALYDEFLSMCRQEDMQFVAEDEIWPLIRENARSLGISSKCMEKEELRWETCRNGAVAPYLR